MSILKTLPEELQDWVGKINPSVRIWIVGGAVRDCFLDRSTADLDFAVSPHALPVAREAAALLHGELYTLDHDRGTVRVIYNPGGSDRRLLDFSELRAASIEDDLLSRDFSVNALAIDLRAPEKLIDPCRGLQDIKDRILRLSHPHSIHADPLRTLRGVRVACELGLRIEDETRAQMKLGAGLLETVSRERIRDEVFRTLSLQDPAQAIHLLMRFGLIQSVLGHGISPHGSVDTIPAYLAELRAAARILEVLGHEFHPEGAADASLGLLSWQLGRFRSPLTTYLEEEITLFRRRRELMLLGAWARAETIQAELDLDPASIAGMLGVSLRLSHREVHWLEKFIAAMNAIVSLELEPVEIYRFFRIFDDSGIASGVTHLASVLAGSISPPPAEAWAGAVGKIREIMDAFFEHRSLIDPAPLVTGDDLISECGLVPGAELGELLELVREAQVRGSVQNKEQAIAWVVRQLGG